jgi:DNA-binding NarL/FixJ family response regulator
MPHEPIRVSSCRFLICHDQDASLKSFAKLIRDQKITHYFFEKKGENLADRIESTRPDIVYIDYDKQPDACLRTINSLRFGYAGRNPYLPVILSSRRRDSSHISPALNSGVDMFIPAPITRAMLSRQIIATVDHRPPYIVSPDYIGPKRAPSNQHIVNQKNNADEQTIIVPNVFALKARGQKVSSQEVKDMIKKTNSEISQIILKKRALGIREIIQNMHYLLQDSSSPKEARDLNLKRLYDSALVSKERIKGTPYSHIVEMYDSLLGLIHSLQNETLPFGKRQLAVMQQTALGITQAFSEDEAVREQATAITDTVRKYSQS